MVYGKGTVTLGGITPERVSKVIQNESFSHHSAIQSSRDTFEQ